MEQAARITGQSAEYEIDIALMRANSSLPEGLEKEFHLQRVLSPVQVNGEPGWSEPSIVGRALLIVQSKDSMQDDFALIMREMRQLLLGLFLADGRFRRSPFQFDSNDE